MTVSARVPGTQRDVDVSAIIGEAVTSPGTVAALDAVARECGFRAFSRNATHAAHELAIAALNAFFATGNPSSAEMSIRNCHNPDAALAIEAETLRANGSLDHIVDAVRSRVLARLPDADRVETGRMVARALTAAIEGRIAAADDSRPLDLIEHEEVVVCFVPGDGVSLIDGMTRYRGFGSDCVSIEPDERLARFLRLVNVSSEEYVAMVKRHRGVDLWDYPEWRSFHVPNDPEREQLLTDEEMLDGIDGAFYGFNPLIAFRANARMLIERDWSAPLSVTGGIVGLHDFANGSGAPQRFRKTVQVCAGPTSFIVGEGRPCDFEEAYGWGPKDFESRVEDAHEVSSPLPHP